MKKLFQLATILVLLLGLAVPSLQAADLAQMQTIYGQQVQKLEQQIRSERLQLPQQYLSKLRDLEAEYQKAGELKPMLAIKKERKRFTGHPRIKDLETVTFPAKLGVLQKEFITRDAQIGGSRNARQRDLKVQYLRALQNLQREYTRQGQIDKAVAVMTEVDAVKAGKGGPATNAPLKPSAKEPQKARKGDLTLKNLRSLLKGEITRWNSRDGSITITYDFSDARQSADWKGGRIDATKRALVCEKTTAWLLPQFASISRIEYKGDFNRVGQRARANIGSSLYVDMQAGASSRVVVHQSSVENPTVEIPNDLKTTIPNYAKVDIAGRTVACEINYQQKRSGDLSLPINYPAYVGFGYAPDTSSYKSVRVTGVLSGAYQSLLKSRI